MEGVDGKPVCVGGGDAAGRAVGMTWYRTNARRGAAPLVCADNLQRYLSLDARALKSQGFTTHNVLCSEHTLKPRN